MINCPVCKTELTISRLDCGGCGVVLEGHFTLPRLARLSPDQRLLAEQLILCGGNLKDLAQVIGISYPTLRRKLDEMIAALQHLKEHDESKVAGILEGIEKGTVKAEEGIRKIKEIQGEI